MGSYLGMPMPQTGTSPTALNQSQTAASTGTSSSPLQDPSKVGGAGQTSQSGGSSASSTPQSTDFGGGNPYLTGLNYQGAQPVSSPVSNLPTAGNPTLAPGGTLNQTQSFAQSAANGQNIFGNAPPPALANIPNIRQNPNGQWSDGDGRLYNPQTGSVFYDPGPLGWNGPGAFTGPVPQYQPTPGTPQASALPTGGAAQGSTWNNPAQPTGQPLVSGGGQMTAQPVTSGGSGLNSPVMSAASARASLPTTTWNMDQTSGQPQGAAPANVFRGPGSGQIPGIPLVPGSTGGSTPTAQNPQVSPTGAPNTYNPFTSNTYPPNTTNPIMFSGNNGPRPYATGQVPQGFGQQPTLSPQFTEGYFNWLYNQMAQGASPYGQQMTFLPGQGGSSMQGLTAPETPLAAQARQGIQGFTDYLGGMIDPARLDALRGEYGPLSQVGQSFAQTGGYGFPGQQLGLQAQYGARGNQSDPNGLYTGAQALQGAASGIGTPGLPGQYLNSAMQFGGMGLPAQTQSAFAQYGAGPGAGGTTLSNMSQTGLPTDVGPAWEAMRQAQQRNIDQQAAQIRERMGLTGNLGTPAQGQSLGTPYGTALTDFYSQTARDQNAALTAASQQAQEAARARQLGAAGTMSGQQLGAAQNLGALQQQAGLFGAGQQNATSQYLQNLMAQGANQLSQNQLGGAGLASNIVGQSQQTPYNIYGNLLGMQQGNLANMANLGQQYQGLDQAAINRQYQEYLRTRPEYNPLLQQMFAGATTFPGVYSQQFGSGALPGLIGQGLGFLGNLFGGGG